jgi:hypothetical protein
MIADANIKKPTLTMKRIFLIALTAIITFSSCTKDDLKKSGGFYTGPVQKFQHGKAWTWLETDSDDKPIRVAIAIDHDAMNSLDPGTGHTGGHTHQNALSLQFHPKISSTPFQHALLDWNPHGHEPEFIYGLPHFDFHFYMTSEEARKAIPPYQVDSLGFLAYPAPGYMPSTMPNLYVPGPGGVPQMGTHWIDVSSPELNGQVFTQTFIYGSYNREVTFYEPMMTKQFLDDNQNFARDIPVPARFKKAGYYPTKMRVERGNTSTSVILEGFVYRQAS